MKRDLTTARAVVETATQECNTLLDVIAASTTEVEAKKEAAVSQEKTLKVPGCSPMLTFHQISTCVCQLHIRAGGQDGVGGLQQTTQCA